MIVRGVELQPANKKIMSRKKRKRVRIRDSSLNRGGAGALWNASADGQNALDFKPSKPGILSNLMWTEFSYRFSEACLVLTRCTLPVKIMPPRPSSPSAIPIPYHLH